MKCIPSIIMAAVVVFVVGVFMHGALNSIAEKISAAFPVVVSK